ncbi:MAG TPA: response regulator [Aggregatilineales bacterium]|nr:response regulator [Anaerolineales bacterium]HRE46247.1 response regulator [Aggregatilineales bacterium]
MHRKTILLADDDIGLRAGLETLLTLTGYEVIEASDGMKALELYRIYRPDVLVCDMKMPIMNGDMVFKVLKADPNVRSLNFILMSGAADATAVAMSAGIPVTNILQKPFFVENLLRLIEDVLNQAGQA